MKPNAVFSSFQYQQAFKMSLKVTFIEKRTNMKFWILWKPRTSSFINGDMPSIWTPFSWLREPESSERLSEESTDSSLNEDQAAKAHLEEKPHLSSVLSERWVVLNFITLFGCEILWCCLLKQTPGSQLINKILNYAAHKSTFQYLYSPNSLEFHDRAWCNCLYAW